MHDNTHLDHSMIYNPKLRVTQCYEQRCSMRRPVVLTPAPGELQGLLVFVFAFVSETNLDPRRQVNGENCN